MASPRIAFFTWKVALSRILRIDNPRRQGFTLVNWCGLCKKNEETINQLLIHSEYISDLWYLVLNLFKVSWAMLNNI